MELVEKLMEYYKENKNDFNMDIEELDNWNGYLADDRIVPMEYFNEYYQGMQPIEILQCALYGCDEVYAENGVVSSFNPDRDYFYYNGYGNLVSTDEWDYTDFLDEYAVQDIIDNECHLSLSDGAQKIIDSYEVEQ